MSEKVNGLQDINTLWIIICACFVFFMQAGFICYEVGFVQSKNVISVAIENLLTFMITTIGFSLIGFPLMFGQTWKGVIGNSFWHFVGIQEASPLGYAFVFFELMFAATAVTIFAGSMSERTKLFPLQIAAVISAALIFPVYGHWVWGGLFLKQDTWLASLGFIDFAGATVVHTTAGFIALAGLMAVGKRNKPRNSRSNIPFAALGVFILWFAWFGFNGGSILAFNDKVGLILLNTNLAAASGMAGALIANLMLSRNGGYLISIFNGTLGGLVAITAASYYLEPMSALIIGLLSGMAVDLSSYLLDKAGIDDAVGAVPIHLFGGIAGTLLLPFFMKAEMLHTSDRLSQFLVQLLGLGVNFCWAFGMAYLMFRLIDKTMGLRVTVEEEEKGLNIVEFADIYSWEKYMEISGYEREINDKNELLRKQARLLAVTEEQEKTKLARDLHDGVGQSLAALKLILGMTKKQLESSAKDQERCGNTNDKQRRSVLQNTEKAVALTENSISEIRNVLNNLKPKPLAENGLAGGLTAMTEDINHTGTLSCSLTIAKPIPHFDETVTLNIYRVIQEALTNVVKHADAKQVEIIAGVVSGIQCAGSAGSEIYAFHILDDGIGFEVNRGECGVGIPSMEDRIKMLGGNFRIESTAGKGTRIIVEVPVTDE
ncbi:histidine kinase [Anoxybacterium hadale]|uniref:Histidine kinase n=1 Tax=Anoxybacterium hadale TaxID=3408580 RepID=A0ACD1A9L8_9FIRM|nr:histidine kinase [Clostridiales bacterium]